MRKAIDRRRFLVGAGAALAIPFLPSLFRRELQAAPGTPPKRFVCLYSPNGQHIDSWLPQGTETSFAWSPVLQPLEKFASKVNVIHNLKGYSGHFDGHSECLTARPSGVENFFPSGGPSADQLLAQRLRSQTAIASLELGAGTQSNSSSIINYSAAALPIPNIGTPQGAFDRVWATVNVDPEEAARRQAQSKSVIDSVITDYQELQPQLAVAERRILDEHLTLLREKEKQLQAPVQVQQCDALVKPANQVFSFDQTVQHHMDILVSALACDVTRVGTLMMGPSGSTQRYPFAGVDEDSHEVAHGAVPDAYNKMLKINQWHASMLAYLLEKMEAVKEMDGSTLLDNTVVFWTNELGLHQFTHSKDNMGVVLAGGCGGFFKTGRLIDAQRAHYHDLLLTMIHAMGFNDVGSFGTDGNKVIGQLTLVSNFRSSLKN
jgi:hypothetical protein